VIVVSTSLLLVAAPAAAQYIGIFRDAGATTCVAQVGPAPYIDLHVVAVPGEAALRVMGAQFQITGAPAGWTSANALWVPADGTLNIGHPMIPSPPRKRGAIVVFTASPGAEGTGTKGPLGRLVLLGAPTPENVHLRVERCEFTDRDPQCPFVLDCNSPDFDGVCVEGGEIVLNGAAATGCGVAVSASTWSAVKSLYQ
jgi:hypothetical protein